MLEAIRILFWPDLVDCITHHQIHCNGQGVLKTESQDICNNGKLNDKAMTHLVGIEAINNSVSNAQLIDTIESYSLSSQQKLFVLTKSLGQAGTVKEYLLECGRKNIELYGVDPSYYLSLVPLGNNKEYLIEKYIVGLKSEPDFKNKIIRFVKNALISFGRSELLYEKFLVISA